MQTEDEGTFRVVDAARQILIHQSAVTADDIAAVTGMDAAIALPLLANAARRGFLVAKLGNAYALPKGRTFALPGESFVTEIRLSVAALMVARA